MKKQTIILRHNLAIFFFCLFALNGSFLAISEHSDY